MNKLTNELDRVTVALRSLTAKTLTADQIAIIYDITQSVKTDELLENYSSRLPDESANEEIKEEYTNEMQETANALNKKADALNDELDRIKKIRQTLNLAGLDPLIQSVRRILHPVYNLTASLQKK